MRHRGRCPRRSRGGARPSPVAERPTGRPRCTATTAARRRRSPRDRATCPLALPDLALQREGALGARLEGHPARAARARDELRAASAVDDRAGEAAYPASRGMGIAPIRARSLRNLSSQTLAPPARPHLPMRRGMLCSRCARSEEHTSELQSLTNLVCRLLLEKKNNPDVGSVT